jgi:alpha-tubulin suppressor-like RCC1 family protein
MVEVDSGFLQTCALDRAGGLWCTGGNLYGTLGLGDNVNRNTFQRIDGTFTHFEIGARANHICAQRGDRSLDCWGRNDQAQLGLSDTRDRTQPTRIDLARVTQVGVGFAHTCAITEGGALYCWGANEHGQVRLGVASSPTEITRLCP